MDENTASEKDHLYRARPNEDDLTRNLHLLYDRVCEEPVPDYLMELLRKLPK